jgi:hypothetical protein
VALFFLQFAFCLFFGFVPCPFSFYQPPLLWPCFSIPLLHLLFFLFKPWRQLRIAGICGLWLLICITALALSSRLLHNFSLLSEITCCKHVSTPAKFRGRHAASSSVFLSLSFPSTPAYVIPRETSQPPPSLFRSMKLLGLMLTIPNLSSPCGSRLPDRSTQTVPLHFIYLGLSPWSINKLIAAKAVEYTIPEGLENGFLRRLWISRKEPWVGFLYGTRLRGIIQTSVAR